MRFIRPFQRNDRAALLEIGAATAFFGAPIEAYLEDRRAFQDAFYAYYTDYEPEHTWVACTTSNQEKVIGFLTGCTDPGRYGQVTRMKILPGVFWNLIRGKYRTGPKTWAYIRALVSGGIRHEFPSADEALYPTHLHINLLPDYRGQGLGRQLIEHYLNQLRSLNLPGVHLHTTNLNRAACHLYEKTGFNLLDARPTQVWKRWVQEPVENRCYGQRL